jgi:apolipoprotein D and lipocalin family protein
MNLFPLLVLALLVGVCSSCAPMKPPATVPHIDLPRFMGDWYVIAHIPYSLEKGKVGTLDRYKLRPDGKIDNSYLFRRGSLDAPLEEWKGVAWVKNKETNAEWRVQFLWPFRVPFLVIDLDKNYEWATIGYPNRKLGWVLSRKPQMDEPTYNQIMNGLKRAGYDTSKFAKVPQRAE